MPTRRSKPEALAQSDQRVVFNNVRRYAGLDKHPHAEAFAQVAADRTAGSRAVILDAGVVLSVHRHHEGVAPLEKPTVFDGSALPADVNAAANILGCAAPHSIVIARNDESHGAVAGTAILHRDVINTQVDPRAPFLTRQVIMETDAAYRDVRAVNKHAAVVLAHEQLAGMWHLSVAGVKQQASAFEGVGRWKPRDGQAIGHEAVADARFPVPRTWDTRHRHSCNRSRIRRATSRPASNSRQAAHRRIPRAPLRRRG